MGLADTRDRLQLGKGPSPFFQGQKAQPGPDRTRRDYNDLYLPVHQVRDLVRQVFNDFFIYPVPLASKDLRPDLDRYPLYFSL